MHIDHIAIAVRDVEAAADRMAALFGYVRDTSAVINSRQQVKVLFLRKEGSIGLKLIEPDGDQSPLWQFVGRGGGLHHLCFRVQDVSSVCGDLVQGGGRLLAGPEPGEAFEDSPIAFLYVGLGLNVEIVDTDARRDKLDRTAQ